MSHLIMIILPSHDPMTNKSIVTNSYLNFILILIFVNCPKFQILIKHPPCIWHATVCLSMENSEHFVDYPLFILAVKAGCSASYKQDQT